MRHPVWICSRRSPGRAGDEFRGRPDNLQGPEEAKWERFIVEVSLVVSGKRTFRVNPDFG